MKRKLTICAMQSLLVCETTRTHERWLKNMWRGLRIADRRKTSTFRLLVQVTGFVVSQALSDPRSVRRLF